MSNQIIDSERIQERIFSIRGVQVMIDRDLAMVYGVETKVLNQAVKRNVDRFPEEFRFQLTGIEKDELVTNCDRFGSLKYNQQYPPIYSECFASAHDRFLILDEKEIYHIGASLKDLGKKWFAFSKFETGALEMLKKLGEARC